MVVWLIAITNYLLLRISSINYMKSKYEVHKMQTIRNLNLIIWFPHNIMRWVHSEWVTIRRRNHNTPKKHLIWVLNHSISKQITVNRNCWISEQMTLLKSTFKWLHKQYSSTKNLISNWIYKISIMRMRMISVIPPMLF